jgi:hypothetical protein
MADKTKLMLSDGELRFVKDTGWDLTKGRIIEAVYQLFNEQVPVINEAFKLAAPVHLPAISGSVPKISKGENYQSLPYVILDHPAVFGKEDIFAVRTMFWWGKFVSITLQLSGKYARELREGIIEQLEADPQDFYVCVNDTQWEHHLEPPNYVPATAIAAGGTRHKLAANNFIKLALKYELEDWNQLPSLLQEGYRKIGALIAP